MEKMIRVDEMKVQIRDLTKDSNQHLRDLAKASTQYLRDLVKILNSTGDVTVSFFNELDTGKELCSGPLFHFLMIFPQRRETMLVAST